MEDGCGAAVAHLLHVERWDTNAITTNMPML
jgi:hypothetical protein